MTSATEQLSWGLTEPQRPQISAKLSMLGDNAWWLLDLSCKLSIARSTLHRRGADAAGYMLANCRGNGDGGSFRLTRTNSIAFGNSMNTVVAGRITTGVRILMNCLRGHLALSWDVHVLAE